MNKKKVRKNVSLLSPLSPYTIYTSNNKYFSKVTE
ncbi:hypothetical protein SAMN05444362_107220 [Dysgonomonas macrotermitis]|uniref:Uncharacterized protein n=1 Tax=Dysgonomonas macrotermitis TaxID=1346286 RepID=A0A1M5CNM0_9BACT|nr:hypothetical protein SAMN05444362_107220 [Dysgonomonas macrotermitis]